MFLLAVIPIYGIEAQEPTPSDDEVNAMHEIIQEVIGFETIGTGGKTRLARQFLPGRGANRGQAVPPCRHCCRSYLGIITKADATAPMRAAIAIRDQD